MLVKTKRTDSGTTAQKVVAVMSNGEWISIKENRYGEVEIRFSSKVKRALIRPVASNAIDIEYN